MDRGRGGVSGTSLLQQHPWQDATPRRLHRHPADQSECNTGWMPGTTQFMWINLMINLLFSCIHNFNNIIIVESF